MHLNEIIYLGQYCCFLQLMKMEKVYSKLHINEIGFILYFFDNESMAEG